MDTGYYISKKDYDKIINYATAAYESMKAEIGGMSICYQDEEGDWIVTDPVILKQKVTGGTCDLDKDALADYYCKAQKKHGKKEFRFCWWHSHHNMGVFWSSTDIKGINEYSDGDLSFALVVNLKRENKFRASMWKPVVMHEDTTLEILENKGSSVPKKIVEEVEELCTKPTYKPYTPKTKDQSVVYRQQAHLWSDWEDDMYNPSYGAYAESKINHGISKEAQTNEYYFRYCNDKITTWINDLTDGTLDYKDYLKSVESENEKLKRLRSIFSIVVIQRNEITEELYWEDPAMWVRINNEPVTNLIGESKDGVKQ